MGHAKMKKLGLTLVGLGLSALMLTFCQAPWNLSFLAWVAWVPFILTCSPQRKLKGLLFTSYVAWLLYWAGNMYWLSLLSWSGIIFFCLLHALYGPLLVFSIRAVRHRKWPLFVTIPLIVVGVEAWQGCLFTGFSWYFLAHSQYEQLPLIQICDIFGQLGISVLIAAVNGLIAEIVLSLKNEKRIRVALILQTLACGLFIAAVTGYGTYRLQTTKKHLQPGPQVGIVQTNIPSYIKEISDNGPAILENLIEHSVFCFDAGADLVAWPETIVLAGLNPEYRTLLQEDSYGVQFDRQIRELATNRGAVLAGAHALFIGIEKGEYAIKRQYNTAFLYHPDGTQDPKRYDKIHLVPFGEFIPFKDSAPWIYRLIMFLSPYDYFYNLTPGSEFTRFELESSEQIFTYGVMICYEDTDPLICRKLIWNSNQPQKADFLVNLSNDGWYVRYNEGQMNPTVELPQRMAITVFRCVENRIPIVRSVNTGISCLIDSTGKIRNQYDAGTLPIKSIQRQVVEGWFVDTIPVDSRITLFSRTGQWLDWLLRIGLVVVFVWSIKETQTKSDRNKEKY